MVREQFRNLAVVLVLVAYCPRLLGADTTDLFDTGATNLAAGANYQITINPFSATSIDLNLSGTYTNPTGLTLNGSALVFGTLNDLNTTQSLVITNSSAFGGSITLSTLANSTPGTISSDLLYVASGGNLSIQNGTGTTTLIVVTSGNVDNAGTLNIAGALNIAIGQTLTFTGSGNTTVSGPIAALLGSVAVNNPGGTVTLSGNNGYLGNTTITAGTLIASNIVVSGGVSNLGNSTGAVILGGAATKGLLDYTGNTANYTRGFSVNNGGGEIDVANAGQTLTISSGGVTTSTAGGTLTIGGPGNTVISSAVANGVGGLTKNGAGFLQLTGANTYGGVTTINGGNLEINAANNLGSAAAGNSIALNGAILESTGNVYSLGTTRSIALGSTGGTIQVDVGNLTVNGAISGTGALTANGAGTLTLAGADTGFTGALIQNAGTVALGNTAALGVSNLVTINGGTLDLSGTSDTIAGLNGAGGSVTNSGSSAATLTIGGGGTNTYSGTITSPPTNSNPNSLNVTLALGAGGSQTLSGNNTYAGVTTVSSGTLVVGNANALGNEGLSIGSGNGGTVVSAGGTLNLNGQSNINEVITLNGTGASGTGALVNSNTSTTATIGSGVSSISATGPPSGLYANTVVTIGAPTSGTTATAKAVLGVTAGTFNINGGATIYLAAPTVTISGGGGTGATAVATLNGLGVVNGITITNPGTGYTSLPTITFSGGSILTALSLPTGTAVDGQFTLDGIQVTNNGSGYTSTPTVSVSSSAITASANLSSIALASNSSIGGAGNVTVNGAISGTGTGLTKVGTGTVTLNAPATYTGGTTVSGGTLALTVANALNNSTSLAISGNSTLALGSNNTSLNGGLTLTNGSITGTGILTASNVGMSYTVVVGTINASLSGSGDALQKITDGTASGGTVILGGADTYTGATTINGGTLEVDGSLGTSSTVTIGGATAINTPTLTGTGTVNGAVIVASAGGGTAGLLNPGGVGSVGTFNVGSLTVQAGALLSFDVNGTNTDLLNIAHAATINAGADIQLNASNLSLGNYVLATAASGLSTTNLTVVGSLPVGYLLSSAGTTLNLQHDSSQSFVLTIPDVINIIAGTTTTVTGNLTNNAPSGSAPVLVNLQDNSSTAGTISNFTSSTGATVAPGATSVITGQIAIQEAGLNQTVSVANSDPSSLAPMAVDTNTANVFNHSTPTLTIASGNNQSGIVGSTLAKATATLSDPGALSVPLDVASLVNLTGTTGSGVVGSNGSATYTSTALNTSSAGIGQTMTLGLGAGDQQTVIGANPLSNLTQTITYNVYNHATPTLTISSGNNQSAFVGGSLSGVSVALADLGNVPAPLDVGSLSNLTGTTGSGVVASGGSGTYAATGFNTGTAGLSKTLQVGLSAGDQQTITGANPLSALTQTVTYNVYTHATPTFTIATGNNQSVIVGSTISGVTLTLSDLGTVPAPLDVNTLSHLTGATGLGVVVTGGSSTYTATGFNTSTAGLNEALQVGLNAGDEQSIAGANALSNLTQTVLYNVYNHSTPTLTVTAGNNQSVFAGGALSAATLTLSDPGTLSAPLDVGVGSLVGLTGATGADVIASGGSGTYTTTGFTAGGAGLNQTLQVALLAGDEQTITGANPLSAVVQNVTYNVYNHATPTLTVTGGNNQSAFVGGSISGVSVALSDLGNVPAPLDVGTGSLLNLTGTTGSGVVTSGGSGLYAATGFNTSAAGLGQTLQVGLSAGDQQTISGANPLSSLAQTVTYNVYNHATPTFTIAAGNNQSVIVGSAVSGVTLTLSDLGIVPAPLDVNSLSHLTGTTGLGVVATGGSGTYTATGFNTSTAGLNESLQVGLNAGDEQSIPGANALSNLTQTVLYNVYNHSTPTLTVTAGNNQSVFAGNTLAAATLTLSDPGTLSAPLDVGVGSLVGLNGATGSGIIASGGSGTYTTTSFTVGGAGLNQSEQVALLAGDRQTIAGANPLNSVVQNVVYNVYNHATSSLTSGTINLGNIHVGYSTPIVSASGLTATNGSAGDLRVNLQGSAASVGDISLNNLSGIASGGSGVIDATLGTGQGLGSINTNLTYTFADQSTIAGALNNVGTAAIAVTGNVYSGIGVWTGNGTSTGTWGTTASGFGLNWGATGGSPGLDLNFLSTDTATFGTITGQPTQLITLNGASPSLNSITFNAVGTTYTLAQGSGGSISLNGGAGAALISDSATGTETIGAPVTLATNANVNVNLGNQLTISDAVSGGGGITTTGLGTTVLSGTDTFTGPTTVNGGVLQVNGSLASGSSVTVGGASATGTPILTGSGMINGSVTIASAGGGAAGMINAGGIGTIGTFDVGSLTVQSGGLISIDMNGTTSDLINIASAASINAGSGIQFNATNLSLGSYVLATAASGLNNASANLTVVGSLPVGYVLVSTGTTLDLQHDSTQALFSSMPNTVNIISGASASVAAVLSNAAPSGSAPLTVNLSDNGSTAGSITSLASSTGSTVSPGGLSNVTGTLTAGAAGLNKTWSIANTDPNSLTPTAVVSGVVNVFNHSSATLAVASGNNQSAIVGTSLAHATVTLSNPGTLPTPLDVNTLVNLTGTTGAGVVGTNGTATYTSTALDTSSIGLGKTMTVGLTTGDEQSVIGSNPLSSLVQTITYNVYNHSTPTLTVTGGSNSSIFVNGPAPTATVTLSDPGTLPAPLDVGSTLTNLTGATGSDVVASDGSVTYNVTGFNSATVGIGRTLIVGLSAGDEQTITGANPLSNLTQTIAYNVYTHATPTLTVTSGNNEAGIVGSTLNGATLTLSDLGTVPAPLDVGSLVNLTGATGAGVVASGGSAVYTTGALNTSTAGVNQTMSVGLSAGDAQSIPGANALSNLAKTVTYSVYNHSTPTLTVTGGNNQSVFVGGSLSGVTVGLSDAGTVPAPLDVTSLNNLTGATGSGVIASGSSGTYTAAGVNASAAGLNQTLQVGLTAGDQQTITGANPLTALTQNVIYNVYNHATSSLTSGTINLGDIHVGYAAPITSANGLTATNGGVGDLRVNLQGSAPGSGDISLNSLSGIASGGSGVIDATLATGQGLGAINTNLTYTFADQSAIAGALNNVGTAAITITGDVYSGNGVWTGNGSAGGSWGTVAAGFGTDWGANDGSPGLDLNFTSTDTATFGTVNGQSTQLVSLNGAAPSLNSITFDALGTAYTLAQGSGGTLTLNGGAGFASIIDSGITPQIISAPVTLATNVNVAVDSGRQLTISGAVTGSGGLTTTGTGTTVLSGTDTFTGAIADNAGTLEINGSTLSTGTVSVASGATLAGTGSTGLVTVAGGGEINLSDGAIGTFTVGSLSIGNGGSSSIAFDIGSSGTDHIVDTGALTLSSGGTTIVIGSLSGSPTLTVGTYTLISAGSVSGSLSDLSLATTALNGKALSLVLNGTSLELAVSDLTSTTTYALSATAADGRIIVGTGSTTISATIANTGSADTLDFSGLTVSASGGTLSGGTLPASGTGLAGTTTGTTTLSAGNTTGVITITPVVGSASNTNLGGNALLDSTVGTVVDVVANRVVTATSVNFGRVLEGAPVGAISTLSTTGDDADFTRVTVGTVGEDVNGIGATGGGDPVFDNASVTDTRTVGGAFTTVGNVAGTLTLVTTGEGLTGEAPINVALNYTADSVAQRVITHGAVTNFGTLHSGSVISATSSAFTTTGAHDTTTDVLVAGANGVMDANGVILTGAATTFDGTISSDTRQFSGTLSSATGGTVSGTFDLGVVTLENGGLGLSGEAAYAPVGVSYTAFVYTGQGVWNAPDGGSWGTITSPINWVADGGTPGLDPNFTTTDSATFGNAIGSGSATITLDGDSPSLNGIEFFNTAGGSYTIGQGSGGTLILDAGSGTAVIINSSGTNTISAPIQLESNTTVATGTGSTLNLNGSIGEQGGSLGLTFEGTGTTTLGGMNTYTGGTTLDSGTLALTGSGTLGATTGSLTIDGGTLDLGGTSQTVGAVSITGPGIIQNGDLTPVSIDVSLPSGTAVIDANLLGPTGLNMHGAGELDLNGNNGYTDGTIISSGTVAVGSLNALGNGDVTLSGGTLQTGNGFHEINVNGDFFQTGGTLLLQVSGTNQGGDPGYDYIHVSGTAHLGGTLEIRVNSGYVPRNGDTFSFIDAGNVAGGFDVVTTNLNSLAVDTQNVGTVTINQLPLANLPGVSLNANQQGIASFIDNAYQSGASSPGFNRLLAALNSMTQSGMPGAALADALTQLSPEKYETFNRSTTISNLSFLTERLDNEVSAQRAFDGTLLPGGGQIDASGLNVSDPGEASSLVQMRSTLMGWSPTPLPHGLLSDSSNKEPEFLRALPSDPINTRAWRVFIAGDAVLAHGSPSDGAPSFHSTTGEVLAGLSYRLTPHFELGALFDFSHTEADLDGIGSRSTLETYQPALFASYSNKGWFVNALGGYGFDHIRQNRNVDFGGLNESAASSPSAHQFLADIDVGHDFHVGNWTLSPMVGLQFSQLKRNAYSETGSDVIDLSVSKETTNSVMSRIGGGVRYDAHIRKNTLSTHLDAYWQHDFLDRGEDINAQLNSVGSGSFLIDIPGQGADSALIDSGISLDINGGTLLYLDYLLQVGQSDYFSQSIEGGARFAF